MDTQDAGTVHLVAHGDVRRQGGRALHRRLLDEVAARTEGRAPAIAYLGAANRDDLSYARGLASFFGELGAGFTHVATGGPAALPRRAALDVLGGADLVYLGGGDVELCMRVLAERELVAPLRAAHRRGASFAGASAGAIALCAYWIAFPDPLPDPPPPFDGGSPFPCLGILPDLVVDMHAEDDDWDELRILLRLLAERDGEERWIGWGVPSSGALRVRAGHAPEDAGDEPCVRLAVRGGSVQEI